MFNIWSRVLLFLVMLDSRINLEPDSKREKTLFLLFIDFSKRCLALDMTLNDLKINASPR